MARRARNAVGRPKAGSLGADAEAVILAAALDLFAAKNFSSVRTTDIARATGFNQALIFYYFKNKEELYRRAVLEAVEQAFQSFQTARDNVNDPAELIGAWIDNHIHAWDAIAKLIKLSIDYAATAKRKATIDRAIRSFYDQERKVLQSALDEGVARGLFGKIDTVATATFISTYLDGVFVRAMVFPDFDPIAAIGNLKSNMPKMLRPPGRG
jgi:AcrR family transcriptional regulator